MVQRPKPQAPPQNVPADKKEAMKLTVHQSAMLAIIRNHGKDGEMPTGAIAHHAKSTMLLVQTCMARLEKLGAVRRIVDKSKGYNSQSWKLVEQSHGK